MKHKVNEYVNQLKENEKLLEENKKMILFLNKNITDITAAPFESRTQKQDEFINKYNDNISGSGTLFQEHDNNIDYKYKTFNTDLQNNNNYLEDDLLALPETNLCNYKLSGQLGGTMDKYITKKIVYANTSAVLIVGMVKDKSKLEDYLHLKQLNSNQYFIEEDVNKFVEVFSDYINLVEKWRNNR